MFIQLTKNARAIVSDEDADLNKYRWSLQSDGYACRNISKFVGGGKCYLHREIAQRMGIDTSRQIDHINGNRLDNHRDNLRAASNAENHQNQRVRSDNASGFKGISPSGGKFKSEIKNGEIREYLGTFNTAEDAARAYDHRARELFGKFAKTNF